MSSLRFFFPAILLPVVVSLGGAWMNGGLAPRGGITMVSTEETDSLIRERGASRPTGNGSIPPWLRQAPPLPPPGGEVIRVSTVDELFAAVDRVDSGGTILLADGEYRLPRPVVLTGRQSVAIRGASSDPARVTVMGRGWESEERNDDLLRIGRCDGVLIGDLTFADGRSYGIKVEAENAPKNIHIYNCRFRNIGVRAIKGSAGRDPAVRAVGGSVRFCRFRPPRS